MSHRFASRFGLKFLALGGVGLLTFLNLLGLPGFKVSLVAQAEPLTTGTAPASSSQDAIALARHLKQIGAKMYGAYWCPHCARQRQLFGRTAFNLYISYIECDPKGYHAQTELCKAAKVAAYPTWVIGEQTYVGVHSLKELADLSGYQGSRDF